MDQIARTTSDLGNVLRNFRKARNLTQAELASRVGILLRGTISNIETGASRAAVQRNLAWMEARGLIREVTGRGRFRMWRAAP